MVGRANAHRSKAIEAERAMLQDLPVSRTADYEPISVNITSSSGFGLRRVSVDQLRRRAFGDANGRRHRRETKDQTVGKELGVHTVRLTRAQIRSGVRLEIGGHLRGAYTVADRSVGNPRFSVTGDRRQPVGGCADIRPTCVRPSKCTIGA